ncbi:OmpA family protein [Elioraea sp. Yellowstone]|jgi:outer membrane protein OmpA-like peptidoglycan-associated protein|uniref:OmpA family protein n=1 Tax=Elioraea sp. Yellowstone TaxID=2592070 RepID=UPI0011536B94|nr:OmpA family protein [Elioraea sp. Yellowstone]TQF76661.1 OmpA family protein [Elioraea sp. Yellowstone]
MKLRTVLLAATMGVLPAVASAQPVNGLYIGAMGGYNIVQDTDLSFSPTRAGSHDAEFDGGWAGIARIGWGFGQVAPGIGLRVELEGNYRDNDVDGIKIGGASLTNVGGSQQTYGVMLNALADFDLGLGFLYPYLGAGIGWAWTNWDSVKGGGVTLVDDDDNNFAFQGIVGLSVPIDAVPGLAINAEYRFFGTLKNEFRVTPAGGGGTVEADNYNHTFLIGLRYAFGVTPPPPAPAPAPVAAPAPARTYLVFFDFDSAALTDRAREIIAEAAANAPRVQATRIEVTGHTDTVGSAAYNQALSLRRANAVAAELERRGIPRSQMVITGRGFSQPLVPTGPNVREPQNRRVEIVLR